MSKKRKGTDSTEEKVTILIENFNTKTEQYEIGKQEILTVDYLELKKILINENFPKKYSNAGNALSSDDIIPDTENLVYEWFLDVFYGDKIEDIGFQARIVTEDFIITKYSDKGFEILDKTQKMFVLRPLYSRNSFQLDKKSELPKKIIKQPFYKNILKFFTPFVLPSLFLTFLFWALAFYDDHYGFDLIFTIFWSWLVLLAFFNIYYSLKLHFKKEKLEYHIPFLNQVKPYDLSRFNILIVLILGIIYLSLYFLFMEVVPNIIRFILNILRILATYTSNTIDMLSTAEGLATIATALPVLIFLCLMGGCGEKLGALGKFFRWFFKIIGKGIYYISKGIYYTLTVPFQLAFLQYKLKREKKAHLIQLLNKHIQERSNNWDVREYFLQLLFEVERVPLVRVDTFTKLLALLTFLLSTIPPFLTLYL